MFINKNVFSILTKNPNWEILTKNLRWGYGWKTWIILGFTKKSFFFLGGRGGEGMKNQYKGEDCLKWGLGQFADLKGDAWQERGVSVFESKKYSFILANTRFL